jgi:hypothetical protein
MHFPGMAPRACDKCRKGIRMSLNIRFAGLCAIVAAFLFVGAACTSARGADPSANWLTGEKLRQQLDQKVSITWSARAGIPLRQALTHLSQAQQVAIVLDRRVDPDQKIEFTSDDASLDATLKLIASKLSIGVAQVGSVIYFGPEATARRVRTLSVLRHDEAIKLPSAARSRILQLRRWRWDDLATPRDLLANLASECHVTIQGTDRVPHDLWAAGDLPPLNFTDRLTLVAAQFDLTFAIDPTGESVSLVEMPATVEISKSYPFHVASGSQAVVAKLSKSLPEAHIQMSGGKLLVRGRAEDQDFVEAVLAGRTAKQTTVTKGVKVYSLPSVKMGVGDLMRALGKRLNLDVQFDDAAIEAAGLSLKTEVTVNVKDVLEDDMLRAVLDPAGLTFDRKGRSITVRPKK